MNVRLALVYRDEKMNYEILHIEENDSEASRIKAILISDGHHNFNISREKKISKVFAYSGKKSIHIILLSHSSENILDISDIQKLSDHYPETCLIVLTDLNDLKSGNDYINQGAHDFLKKDNLNENQLKKAIFCGLSRIEISRRFRSQEAELIKFKSAVEQSENSIVITDLDGKIEYVNKKFEKVTGYSAAEAFGKNPSILSSGLHSDQFYADMWQKIVAGESWYGEIVNRSKTGDLFWESSTINPIKDDEGKVIKYLAVKEEITERKKEQEKLRINEQHMRFLVNASTDLLKMNSVDEVMQYIAVKTHELLNKKGFTIVCQYINNHTEYEIRAYQGINSKLKLVLNLLKQPIIGFRSKVDDDLINLLQDHKIHRLPIDLTKLIGNHISEAMTFKIIKGLGLDHIHVTGIKTKDQLFGSLVFAGVNDNPELDQEVFESFMKLVSLYMEKNQATQLLIKNEKRFKEIAESAGDWIWEIDKDGVFTYSSPAIKNILGYSPEEVINKKSYFDLIDLGIRNATQNQMLGNIERKETYRNQINIHEHKSGHQIWIKSSGGPILNEQGNLIGFRGINSDITLILKSREQFKEIIQYAPSAIYLHDYSGKILLTNKKAMDMLGYSQIEILETNINALDYQYNELGIAQKVWDQVLKQGSITFESIHKTKFGGSIPVEINVGKITYNNKPHFLAFVKDIGDRIASEKEQKRNAALMTEAHLAAKIGSWIWDIEKNEVQFSLGVFAVLNKAHSNKWMNLDIIRKYVYPEDLDKYQSFLDILAHDKTFKNQTHLRIINSKGELRHIYVKPSSYTEKDSMLFGIIQDVTDLYENQRKLEDAQQIAKLGSWKYYVSENVFGFSKEAEKIVKGAIGHDIERPDENSRIPSKQLPNWLTTTLKKSPKNYEIKVTSDNVNKWILINSFAQLNENGEIFQIVGIIQDISERKEAQNKLEQNERSLEKALEIAVMGRFNHQIISDEIIWSEKAIEILALEPSKIPTQLSQFPDIIHPEDRTEVMDEIKQCFDEKIKFTKDYRIITQSGKEKWIKVNVDYEFSEDGEILSSDGIIRDIHDEKIKEKELEKANLQLRNIIKNVPGIVFRCRFDDDYTMEFISDQCKHITGYSSEEFYSKRTTFESIINPRDAEKVRKTLQSALDSIKEYEVKYRIKTKSGEERWIWESGSIRNSESDKSIILIDGTITDITDIAETEEKILNATLRGEDDERRRIAKDIHDGVQQTLISAMLSLQSVESEMASLKADKAKNFKLGMKMLKDGVEETRSIAHSIMPKSIQDFGLVKTLESLSQNITETKNVVVNFYENLGATKLDIIIETSLYRICQEALNNIFKYANATEITIQLMKYEDCILFTIEDNGKGFDTNNPGLYENGLGLSSMQSRASAISATLDISSHLGAGTNILVEIPVASRINL